MSTLNPRVSRSLARDGSNVVDRPQRKHFPEQANISNVMTTVKKNADGYPKDIVRIVKQDQLRSRRHFPQVHSKSPTCPPPSFFSTVSSHPFV